MDQIVVEGLQLQVSVVKDPTVLCQPSVRGSLVPERGPRALPSEQGVPRWHGRGSAAAGAAAIGKGHALRRDAGELLDTAVNQGAEADPEPIQHMSDVPRGKPRTVIVQEWIRGVDEAELRERAWAATIAACG